jgi:hypothetical protein
VIQLKLEIKMNENKIENLNKAILEAERFIEKAELAVIAIERDGNYQYSFKDLASAKRASMDLTRALVSVRSTNQ